MCLVRGFDQFSMAPSTSVHDGRRPFFPVSPYSLFTGPCKGPCTWGVPHTWFCPVFHGARPLLSTTGVGHFFPCPRITRSRVRVRGMCYVRGFNHFSMACVHFRPRRASGTFFPCPRITRSRVIVRVRVCGVRLVRGFAQYSMERVHFRP